MYWLSVKLQYLKDPLSDFVYKDETLLSGYAGCVSLTTQGLARTAHSCCGRHSWFSCELVLCWGDWLCLTDH